MSAGKRISTVGELRCSFCNKNQELAGKLIASPTQNRPQIHICDMCVAVCNGIIEDDKRTGEPEVPALAEEGRFVHHPLAAEFLNVAERWAVRELTGLQAGEELIQMRALAARLLAEEYLPIADKATTV